jgi:hypothetical protein
LTVGVAATLTALAVAGTASISRGLLEHSQTVVLAGVAIGLAAVAAWHGVLLGSLSTRVGVGSLVCGLDLFRSDVGLFVAAGVAGACVGWVYGHVGSVGAGALLIALTMFALAAQWRLNARSNADEIHRLGDEEMLDLARSALLDLPASRLPTEV